jgi:hypothetical protein
MNKFRVTDYDIIYLSYDEPNAEKNYADLCQKIPWAKRVHGIEGSDAAHKACARLSETDRFITVDGDNIVRPGFLEQVLDIPTGSDLESSVISWCGKNEIMQSSKMGTNKAAHRPGHCLGSSRPLVSHTSLSSSAASCAKPAQSPPAQISCIALISASGHIAETMGSSAHNIIDWTQMLEHMSANDMPSWGGSLRHARRRAQWLHVVASRKQVTVSPLG